MKLKLKQTPRKSPQGWWVGQCRTMRPDDSVGRLRVEVERVVLVSPGGARAAHHEYEMRVSIGPRSWTVRRRYREFDELRGMLELG